MWDQYWSVLEQSVLNTSFSPKKWFTAITTPTTNPKPYFVPYTNVLREIGWTIVSIALPRLRAQLNNLIFELKKILCSFWVVNVYKKLIFNAHTFEASQQDLSLGISTLTIQEEKY